MIKICLINAFLFLLSCNNESSTDDNTLTMNFNHLVDGKSFELSVSEISDNFDHLINISELKYFVTNIQFTDIDQNIITLDQTFFIDLQKNETILNLEDLPQANYQRVSFSIGMDSLTNHSDPASHSTLSPLNPANNDMYWNWMAGYIFISMEGSVNSTDNDRLNGFAYHLGKVENKINIAFDTDIDFILKNHLNVEFELAKIFNSPNSINLLENPSIHSNDEDEISSLYKENIVEAFSIKNE